MEKHDLRDHFQNLVDNAMEDYNGALWDPKFGPLLNPRYQKPTILILYNKSPEEYKGLEPTGGRFDSSRVEYVHRSFYGGFPPIHLRGRVRDIIFVNVPQTHLVSSTFLEKEFWPLLRSVTFETSPYPLCPKYPLENEYLVKSDAMWFTIMRKLWVSGSVLLYTAKDEEKPLLFSVKLAPDDVVTYNHSAKIVQNGVKVVMGNELIVRSLPYHAKISRRKAILVSPVTNPDTRLEIEDARLFHHVCRNFLKYEPPYVPRFTRVFILGEANARSLAQSILLPHGQIYHICVNKWKQNQEPYGLMASLSLGP